MIDLPALKALCEAATQLDWEVTGDVIWTVEVIEGSPQMACCGRFLPTGECCGEGTPLDTREQQQVQIGGGPPAVLELAVAARTALPELIAEMEGLRAENSELRFELCEETLGHDWQDRDPTPPFTVPWQECTRCGGCKAKIEDQQL